VRLEFGDLLQRPVGGRANAAARGWLRGAHDVRGCEGCLNSSPTDLESVRLELSERFRALLMGEPKLQIIGPSSSESAADRSKAAIIAYGRRHRPNASSGQPSTAPIKGDVSMSRRLKQFLIATLGLVLVWGTASPASAAADAYNTRYQYLTGSPTPGGGQSCTERDIYLAEGDYAWVWTTRKDGVPFTAENTARTIYLAAGNYQWTDCVTQWTNGDYIQSSYLLLDGRDMGAEVQREKYFWSGWWTWGSFLHQISTN
jgi:hypothetical protein